LPADLRKSDYFLANENRFYRTKEIQKDFQTTTIKELNKDEFCSGYAKREIKLKTLEILI
jgi:hypothetical protein